MAAAIDALPPEVGAVVRRRIRESAGASRPVVCPLLDLPSGECLVYDARTVACRTYGFYVERESVLGCARIAAIAAEARDVIWGNHAALGLESLGSAAPLFEFSD